MTPSIYSFNTKNFSREFPHDNINSTLKIIHFILQQVVDKSTALSNKHMDLYFKKSNPIFLNVSRPLAWHSVLLVNVFICI